ncbi:MAG: hypothetical protein AAF628_26155 [Planctomycetota bacterium]
MFLSRLVSPLLLASLCGGSIACQAEDVQVPAAAAASRPSDDSSGEPHEFTRFVRVGEDEGRFETAVTKYRNAQGAEVSLVAAVHIADAAHYDDLNELFGEFDAVLYELVAEEGDRPSPDAPRRSNVGMVSMLQGMLKSGLELEFQLNAIDYTKDRFVHADLTPQSFKESMEERGESFLSMFFKLMMQEMRKAQEAADEGDGPQEYDVVSAFRGRYGRHTMRMMFAEQLGRIEAMASGAGEGTTLLEGRNERALEVLAEQLGKGRRRLAIYYGAAHMPGIEKTLLEEMGFEFVSERWLLAWDISKRPDPKRKKPR